MMAKVKRIETVKGTKEDSTSIMKPPNLKTDNLQTVDYEVIIIIAFKNWFIVILYILKICECLVNYGIFVTRITNSHRK